MKILIKLKAWSRKLSETSSDKSNSWTINKQKIKSTKTSFAD